MYVPVRRGEIRRYRAVLQRAGQPELRLILSADALNEDPDRALVMATHVVDVDPGGLLHVKVGDHGWAAVATLQPVLRSRLDELVGQATAEELTAVEAAVAALLDLG